MAFSKSDADKLWWTQLSLSSRERERDKTPNLRIKLTLFMFVTAVSSYQLMAPLRLSLVKWSIVRV